MQAVTAVMSRCTIRDCVYIEDGTILPPETVVPAFSRYDIKIEN